MSNDLLILPTVTTYIPKTTYIVILGLVLLVISIILEVIRIKIMRKKSEEIINELIIFFILLEISLIVLIFYVCKFGLIKMMYDETGIGLTRITSGGLRIFNIIDVIEFIIPCIILIITIIMVLRPLIYIIKYRKNLKNNNPKEEKHGK